jgi:hypothetical protein
VKVIVVVPPQADGAPLFGLSELLLFDNTGLHPPLTLALANHAVKAASIASWVWQDGSVVLVGGVKVNTGAGVTVKVALHD